MTRSRSSNNSSVEGKPSALARTSSQVQDTSLSRQLSETLLGVKGSMLRQKNSPPPEVKEENPLARLKLLLVRNCRICPSLV
jgi:hydroxymethylglutaryl-CoA reductase (NADPH)